MLIVCGSVDTTVDRGVGTAGAVNGRAAPAAHSPIEGTGARAAAVAAGATGT